jgi:hypothetical protein
VVQSVDGAGPMEHRWFLRTGAKGATRLLDFLRSMAVLNKSQETQNTLP